MLAALEQSARNLAPTARRLLAESEGRMRMLDPASIEVVEADRNYVTLRVGREIYHARSTLQQAEDQLKSQPILRISRSCLVNTHLIQEVAAHHAATSYWCCAAAPPSRAVKGFVTRFEPTWST